MIIYHYDYRIYLETLHHWIDLFRNILYLSYLRTDQNAIITLTLLYSDLLFFLKNKCTCSAASLPASFSLMALVTMSSTSAAVASSMFEASGK